MKFLFFQAKGQDFFHKSEKPKHLFPGNYFKHLLNRLKQICVFSVLYMYLFCCPIRQCSGNSRFPRVEDMPHFHYDFVDLGEEVKVS